MAQLTDRQFGILQESIDEMLEQVARQHLNIEVETNFADLTALTTTAPGATSRPSYNPTFDPRYNDLRGRGFWFRLVDEDGNTVGCHADRIFQVDDFVGLMRSGRLWYDDGFAAIDDDDGTLELVPGLTLEIDGVVAYSGIMWLERSCRGAGLALLVKNLSRALCLRNFESNYHAGLIRQSLTRHDVPARSYGYPHMTHCIEGYFPPTGQRESLYVCHIDRGEMLDQLGETDHSQRAAAAALQAATA